MRSPRKIAGSGSSPALRWTANRTLIHGVVLASSAVFLSSCGGGGGSTSGGGGNGGQSQMSISFSTNSISFKAAGPFAQAPATQAVTGTVTGVTSGTVYLIVTPNNPNSFFTVANPTFSGNSGQVSVVPATPFGLQAGSYQGSISVVACLNDPTCATGQLTGSPQTILVSYENGTGVDGDTVAPRVVPANAAGTVILRGGGFTGATSVSFGSTPATSVTLVSDTEIHAGYPALAAGTYSVTINTGAITYAATLVTVAPPAYSATFISPPSGGIPVGIEYDAEHAVLYAAVAETSPDFELQRYPFNQSTNTWGSPTQTSIQNLVQFHLSPDGSHLLALVQNGSQASMVELDPITLEQTKVTSISTPRACGFALANDGNAIVGNCGSLGAATPGFVFGTFSRIFSPMLAQTDGILPTVASENGAIVALDGTNFVASTEMVSQTGTAGYSADLTGDKFIDANGVLNQTGQLLGSVSTPNFNVINWAGTRVYGYSPNSTSCASTLSAFDLTATPSGGQYPELGTPISLPVVSPYTCDDGGDLLAITPDGNTVFILSASGVFVQPITP